MALDRPAGEPNARAGDAAARMKGQASATATRPSGPPPGKAPKPPGTKLWMVTQHRTTAPADYSPWEFQGVFTSREQAIAACRNERYAVHEVEADEPLPDETVSMPDPEWPRIRREQHRPSPHAEAAIARYAEQGFHGGEPNADGSYTTDRYLVDASQRTRYYPAANAAAWFHDSARLWAMVDDLTRQDADSALVAELRRMARGAYEIAYQWERGALSGLPEYASWQEEGAGGEP